MSLISIFEMTNSRDANAGACTVTNGVYSETEIKNGCDGQPDFYEIVIFEMYLCTAEPTIPTVTAAVDLTNCSKIFNNAAGATANVAQGGDVDLTGTYTRPPDATYTHGYARMDNTFGITASIKIDGSMDGQASGSGVFCGTVSGSGNHTKASGSHNDESICSASAVTGAKYTETLTHFGGSGDAWTRVAEAAPTPGASIKGILVDSNGHLDSTDTVIHVSGESHSSKFQIRQNSKGFNNLKFEPTQVGAGAARLGKVPLDMLRKLLPDYGVKDFSNRWQDYPHNGQEFEEVGHEYVKMFEEVYSDTDNNISKGEFYDNIANSFMSSDATYGYTTSKLMQLKFVHGLMTLSESQRNELLTQMLYLAKKMGPRFGPHGKLY